MHKFLAAFLALALSLTASGGVSARQQNLAYARLYSPDLSAFPEVALLLDVFNSRGIFASGLNAADVTITEDGTPLPIDSLLETAVPLQLAVAVNQGQALDVRDKNNLSRFERAAQILVDWASQRPADLPDDYSLVSQAGAVINHASAADFAVGLGGFKPDFRAAAPNLLSLSIALDTAAAQTPQLGMKRAVLFITPGMDDFNFAELLQPYLQRAQAENIRVFVWYIDLATKFQSPSALAFNDLALNTGGQMFAFSGAERFPDPEAYFSALRRVYALKYTSRVKTSGGHGLTAKVSFPNAALESLPQTFDIQIQPPSPFAFTNDLNIARRPAEDNPFNIEALQPKEQEVRINVEFPDGHPRALTRTTLYVDNVIMDENTSAPFDVFTWDISAYEKSGEHQLRVEAVDVLGLQNASLSAPVMVTVVKPLSGWMGLLKRYQMPLTLGAILLAGLTLFAILFGSRFKFPSWREIKAARRAQADPLTQSIPVQPAAPVSAARNVKTQSLPKIKKEADAMLMRLSPDGQVAPVAPLLIFEKEITFGVDPAQCSQILDDPSISPVHARLRPTEDGGYLLIDNNSLAGTWVNYDPVPREGLRLRHGDVIHFGGMAYRFTVKNPPEATKPVVTPLPFDE